MTAGMGMSPSGAQWNRLQISVCSIVNSDGPVSYAELTQLLF